MWSEAINVAVYLTNRSPIIALDNKTPFESPWFWKKPDLSNLRVFGCSAYATLPKNQTKKLDDRATEYVFVGYGINCWRLWDESKQKIICSPNVKFNELKSKNLTVEIEESDHDVTKAEDPAMSDVSGKFLRCTS